MEMSFPDIPLEDDNKVKVQLPLSEQETSKMHCLMGFVWYLSSKDILLEV